MELFCCNSVSTQQNKIHSADKNLEEEKKKNRRIQEYRAIVKFKELPGHAYEMVFDVTFANVNEYIQIYFVK